VLTAGGDLVGNTRRRVELDVGDDDVHSSSGEAQRDTSPDSASAPNYDRAAADQLFHDEPLDTR
jgi:hypothetical protein